MFPLMWPTNLNFLNSFCSFLRSSSLSLSPYFSVSRSLYLNFDEKANCFGLIKTMGPQIWLWTIILASLFSTYGEHFCSDVFGHQHSRKSVTQTEYHSITWHLSVELRKVRTQGCGFDLQLEQLAQTHVKMCVSKLFVSWPIKWVYNIFVIWVCWDGNF